MVIKHWNNLLRAVTECPTPMIFKTQLDMALSNPEWQDYIVIRGPFILNHSTLFDIKYKVNLFYPNQSLILLKKSNF